MSDPKDSVCPDCGAELPPDAVICVACGLHLATGKKVGSEMPAAAKKPKPQAGSGKKKSHLIVATMAVLVLLGVVVGVFAWRGKAGSKPVASPGTDNPTTGDTNDVLSEAQVTRQEGILQVTGPQYAVDVLFPRLANSSLLSAFGPQFGSMSPTKVLTVAIVAPPAETSVAAATTTVAALRAEVRTAPTGAPVFSHVFVGTSPASSEQGGDPLFKAKQAAAAEMAAGLPALLGAAALNMVGKPALLVPRMQQWLASTDTDQQRVACLYLAQHPSSPEAVLPHVVRFLAAPEIRLRRDALATVAAYGPQAAPFVPAILRALQDTDEETRDRALELVDTLRDEANSGTGGDATWLEAQFLPAGGARKADGTGEKPAKKEDKPDEEDLGTLVQDFDQPQTDPAKLEIEWFGKSFGLGELLTVLLYLL